MDDNSEIVIEKLEQYRDLTETYFYAVAAIGNFELRMLYLQKFWDAFFQITILVHSQASISPSV